MRLCIGRSTNTETEKGHYMLRESCCSFGSLLRSANYGALMVYDIKNKKKGMSIVYSLRISHSPCFQLKYRSLHCKTNVTSVTKSPVSIRSVLARLANCKEMKCKKNRLKILNTIEKDKKETDGQLVFRNNNI